MHINFYIWTKFSLQRLHGIWLPCLITTIAACLLWCSLMSMHVSELMLFYLFCFILNTPHLLCRHNVKQNFVFCYQSSVYKCGLWRQHWRVVHAELHTNFYYKLHYCTISETEWIKIFLIVHQLYHYGVVIIKDEHLESSQCNAIVTRKIF